MRFIKLATRLAAVLALPVAFAATLGAAPPAAAQTAGNLQCNGCVNSRDLKNNGIRSRDIRNGQVKGADLNPTISIGTASNDGDLGVKDTAGTETVSLDGDTGTVTNSLDGNGLVKGWARINTNGTVAFCYRCNLETSETRRLSAGIYEVDFTPVATDIQNRPRLCAPDGAGNPEDNSCATAGSGDTSTVVIRLYDIPNSSFNGVQGDPQDASFTVVIF